MNNSRKDCTSESRCKEENGRRFHGNKHATLVRNGNNGMSSSMMQTSVRYIVPEQCVINDQDARHQNCTIPDLHVQGRPVSVLFLAPGPLSVWGLRGFGSIRAYFQASGPNSGYHRDHLRISTPTFRRISARSVFHSKAAGAIGRRGKAWETIFRWQIGLCSSENKCHYDVSFNAMDSV